MTWQGSLIPLFWILLLAFAFQAITSKIPWLRIPTIIAYIVLGIILGNGGAPWSQPLNWAWLNGISHFGLFYLMFLSGMEVDMRLLRFSRPQQAIASTAPATGIANNPLHMGLALFALTAVLSYTLSWFMSQMDHHLQAWMMMLVLSTTSLGIVLPVLREQGLHRTRYGQTLLTAALLADLVTMLCISIATDMYTNGFSLHQLSVGLLLPFLIACYFAIARFQKTSLWQRWLQPDATGKLQAVLALLGLFGVLTDFTGSEPILGSFLAGILLSCFQLREDNKLRQQLEVVGYGFIIPIFFVMVGVNFKLDALLNSRAALAWIPLLLIAAYAVKVLPMIWLGRSYGTRNSWAGGLLLSSRMTLVIVACTIGVQIGVIPRAIDQAMLVVAVVTCMLSPILFTMVARKRMS
jgi:CPA2 family monovalent cation:H+ antiporter-2/trk system potassium uptake protein TrkA